MKQKIAALICALALLVCLSACGNNKGAADSSSVKTDMSSVLDGNIPEGNTDGHYDTDSKDNDNNDNDNNSSSKTLEDDISSFISSEKDMLSSIVGD